ncbi:MAG: hypothetical protein ABI398_06680 [Devosia sp.]
MGDLRINRPRRIRSVRPAKITALDIDARGDNGGPPLDHVPEWGVGGIGNYFAWRAASEAAFKKVPVETMLRRAKKAESLGLTYREYQLEVLERSRFLQVDDIVRIAEIKAKRPK